MKRDHEELIEGVGILCQKLGDKVDIGLVIGDPDIGATLYHSMADNDGG